MRERLATTITEVDDDYLTLMDTVVDHKRIRTYDYSIRIEIKTFPTEMRILCQASKYCIDGKTNVVRIHRIAFYRVVAYTREIGGSSRSKSYFQLHTVASKESTSL